MRIISLQLKNFKVLRGERNYEFSDGIVSINGHNGHGKSTILNAIAYAFYGPEVLPGGRSNIVTWGEKSAKVTLKFEIDGRTYELSRSPTRASLHLGETVLSDGLDPTTKHVSKLIGLDRVGFMISVFSTQKELAALSSLDTGPRTRAVLRLLEIDSITSAADRLKSDARALKKTLELLRANVTDDKETKELITTLNEDIVDGKKSVSDYEQLLSSARAAVEDAAAHYAGLGEARKAFDRYDADHRRLALRLAAAEGALGGAQARSEGIPPPEPGQEPPDPSEALRSIRSDIRFSNKSIETLELAQESAICPLCQHECDQDHISNLISELDIKLVRLQEELEDELVKEALYEHWVEQSKVYKEYLERYSRTQEAVTTASKKIYEIQKEIGKLISVPDVRVEAETALHGWREAGSHAADVREALAGARERVQGLVGRLERAGDALLRSQTSRAQIEATEAVLTTTQIAASELMQLKDDLIGRVIPTLSESSSRLVSEMTDGQYTELILSPDYEIQYRNQVGDRKDFENLSKGEQDVFALALRLALADLKAGRIGVLMLDEIMPNLDEDRLELVWNALQSLSRRYHQILLVTHLSEFRDRASESIQL